MLAWAQMIDNLEMPYNSCLEIRKSHFLRFSLFRYKAGIIIPITKNHKYNLIYGIRYIYKQICL